MVTMVDAMVELPTMRDLATAVMVDLTGAAGTTKDWFSDLRITVHKRCP